MFTNVPDTVLNALCMLTYWILKQSHKLATIIIKSQNK
jgi:hypothetical protein